MNSKTYKFSFLVAGSLKLKTYTILQYACNNWIRTKCYIIEQNLFLKDKMSIAEIQFSEIKSQIKNFRNKSYLLCNDPIDDIRSIIWLPIIKTYTFTLHSFQGDINTNQKN